MSYRTIDTHIKTPQKALLVVALFAVAWLVVRFVMGGPEDTWICDDGQWVQHGNPSADKPTTGCANANSDAAR